MISFQKILYLTNKESPAFNTDYFYLHQNDMMPFIRTFQKVIRKELTELLIFYDVLTCSV